MSETPHMQMANIHIHNHKHNLGPKWIMNVQMKEDYFCGQSKYT